MNAYTLHRRTVQAESNGGEFHLCLMFAFAFKLDASVFGSLEASGNGIIASFDKEK